MLNSLFTHSWRSANSIRHNSSFLLRTPPTTAPRECPTPLVFVSAKAWDAESDKGMTSLSSMLAEQGFTCLQTDLALPDPGTRKNSSATMEWFENELRSSIRLSMLPFRPVIFARSAGCLISQTYISSNSATGIVLISPPADNQTLKHVKGSDGLPLLPTDLPEFDFEPYFRISVMAEPEYMKVLRESNRLVKDPDVDKIVVDDLEGQQAFVEIQQWLDTLGI